MIVIDNEQVSMFDVDETLVLTEPSINNFAPWDVLIRNPYDEEMKPRFIHSKHVELLKQMHGRGRLIGVWSGGGVQWAKAVVEALELQNYVHIIMTKPVCYVDDYPSSQWLNNQIYLKP